MEKNGSKLFFLNRANNRGSAIILTATYRLYGIKDIIIYSNKIRILSDNECIVLSVEVPKTFTKDGLLNKIKSDLIQCKLNPNAHALLVSLFSNSIDEIVLEIMKSRKNKGQ